MDEVRQKQIRELTEMRSRFHQHYVNELTEKEELDRLRKEIDAEIAAIEAGTYFPGGVFDPYKKPRKWGR